MSADDCLANRHFLAVDDEPFIRTLVARFLKRSGAAEVVEAADGGAAIAAIGSYDFTFDAVISDVNMRPINGIELLRAIRTGAGGLKRNTPVLMLTVHGEAALVTEALALDADAFVLKPVERATLVERVLRVLERGVAIGSAAHYLSVGGAAQIEPAAALAPAPPTKSLYVSERASNEGDTSSETSDVVRRVALDEVLPNSILARDIHVLGTSLLLLGAPVILTQALLDRLNDLRTIHDGYAYVVVLDGAR